MFQVSGNSSSGNSSGQKEVNISSKGVSWPKDLEFFKNSNSPKKQGMDMKEERLQVWMRVAGVSKFSKLWGIIREDLKPGKYSMKIGSNFNFTDYSVRRSFRLLEGSVHGGAGAVPMTIYWVGFAYCITSSIAVAIVWRKENNSRKMR